MKTKYTRLLESVTGVIASLEALSGQRLWTKADSVTYFDDLTIKTETGEKSITF